jgi:hypothetical protein
LITHVCKPSIGPILRDALPRAAPPVNASLSWALATTAGVAGYLGYGWPGVVLALTVVVFWMLLQFSRALRAMRKAAAQPIGRIDNAVMLHAKLRTGLRLIDVMKLAGSLGRPDAGNDAKGGEVFFWTDEAGDSVRVELRAGLVSAWLLLRADAAPASSSPADPTA